MTQATLVLPEAIATDIAAKASLPLETAGVLLASIVATEGGPRLLARGMRWVPEGAYKRRGYDHLSIASEGYVPFLAEAEALGVLALWLHTHPGLNADPTPSIHDAEVDRQIAALFRLRTASPYYGAVVFSPRPSGLAFMGFIEDSSNGRTHVARLWEVGDRFRLTPSFDTAQNEPEPIFDRNVRAFGGGVQHTLSQLRVGIIGCGGTGSAIAEQLLRLGVRRMLLIDPDQLSESNVTRVYGSTAADVGRFKVDVLSDHLRRIAPDASCTAIRAMITTLSAARQLCECDIVFGCTDDNAGRLVLARFSTYLLTPVVDSGVLLTSDEEGILSGIYARVTTMTPGQACLVCRQRIDLARASSELMTPGERQRREEEGYAPALGHVEPAVVAFTTAIAATAVGELLERLIGYGPTPRPSEVLLRCHEREISTTVAQPNAGHYCDPAAGKLGKGVTDPFLEQVWVE